MFIDAKCAFALVSPDNCKLFWGQKQFGRWHWIAHTGIIVDHFKQEYVYLGASMHINIHTDTHKYHKHTSTSTHTPNNTLIPSQTHSDIYSHFKPLTQAHLCTHTCMFTHIEFTCSPTRAPKSVTVLKFAMWPITGAHLQTWEIRKGLSNVTVLHGFSMSHFRSTEHRRILTMSQLAKSWSNDPHHY